MAAGRYVPGWLAALATFVLVLAVSVPEQAQGQICCGCVVFRDGHECSSLVVCQPTPTSLHSDHGNCTAGQASVLLASEDTAQDLESLVLAELQAETLHSTQLRHAHGVDTAGPDKEKDEVDLPDNGNDAGPADDKQESEDKEEEEQEKADEEAKKDEKDMKEKAEKEEEEGEKLEEEEDENELIHKKVSPPLCRVQKHTHRGMLTNRLAG